MNRQTTCTALGCPCHDGGECESALHVTKKMIEEAAIASNKDQRELVEKDKMKIIEFEEEFADKFCTVGHKYLLNSNNKEVGEVLASDMVLFITEQLRKQNAAAEKRVRGEIMQTYEDTKSKYDFWLSPSDQSAFWEEFGKKIFIDNNQHDKQ